VEFIAIVIWRTTVSHNRKTVLMFAMKTMKETRIMTSMSEMNNKTWAVISERGVEASDLTYNDAHDTATVLNDVTASHATVVSNEAAQRDAESRKKSR
jgi:hypothetical protein